MILSADELFSNVGTTNRQLVVGDSIRHTILGVGTVVSGWEGYLEVSFPSATKVFTDQDGYCLVPSPLLGTWYLLRSDQAQEWIEDFNRHRDLALRQVRDAFQQTFIEADAIFEEAASEYLTRDEYEHEKLAFVQNWVKRSASRHDGKASKVPDNEQAVAIGSVNVHTQVVARAGSGKTETVANRAIFLQKHCRIDPSEILLLAFNADAAGEMAQRVEVKLDSAPKPHIMTFHALAYAIVPGAKDLLVNQPEGGEQSLSREFQQVLMDAIEDTKFEARVRKLMLAHFRTDWEKIVRGGFNLSREDMLRYRRSLAAETLRGDYVKSFGEKVIGNFLFEHDVPYLYEQNHWASGRNYRPDFTISKSRSMPKGIVIEYFGLAGDPDYDEEAEQKRAYWARLSNEWNFIELAPSDFAGGQRAFEQRLADALSAANVPLTRLSDDEIWHRVRQRSILWFTKAATTFVGRCRKQWIPPEGLARLMSSHDYLNDVEKWFVEIVAELYSDYLNRLNETGADDFDGLMQRAVLQIAGGKSDFSRKAGDGDLSKLRYLFVDEYQDFTELFYRMVQAIRKLNPAIQVFTVGDDWQAINRFAGSDLRYYNQFEEIFKPSLRLQITTNRRSTQRIVEVSNALMVGRGDAAVSASSSPGLVTKVDLATFKPTSLEEMLFNKSLITPVVLRLAGKALDAGKSVVLLSVRNNLVDPGGGVIKLDKYLSALRSKLPAPLRDGLSISTAHGYKGNESDVVIILDAKERSYPLIHPNWVFARILGESIEAIVDESRRLFYVSLTRAREEVFIITESGLESPFLTDITSHPAVSRINWSKYPPLVTQLEWVTVKVVGEYQMMLPLIDCLKADSFRYRDLSRNGGYRSWDRSYRVRELTDSFLLDTPWMTSARQQKLSGVMVQFYDGLERCFMACTISGGDLLIEAQQGSRLFNLNEMKSALAPPEPVDILAPGE